MVLGAGVPSTGTPTAEDPRSLVPDGAQVVVAEDWAEGMSASLRRGLAAATETDATAVLVTLVDLPHLLPEALHRVTAAASGPAALARAVDGGHPGHPVLIGRDHWPALAASLAGDTGARAYLTAAGAVLVDCTGLGSGRDVDARDD